MSETPELITRDWLAIERTKLANERTFLAYFRTFIVILGTGITLMKLDLFQDLKSVGLVITVASPLLLVIGILRFAYVRRNIRSHYKPKF